MAVRLNTNLKFVFASTNEGKLKEVKQICESLNWECISPRLLVSKYGLAPEVSEGETSYLENAKLKAFAFYKWCNLYPVIADDTGLEVNVLGGQPGVKSARYAGFNATMEENKKKLLSELTQFSDLSCCFKCTLCFFDGDKTIESTGTLSGRITKTAKGVGGFGYDDLFIPDKDNPLELTLSQLKESNFKSTHRYLAFKELNNRCRSTF